MTSNGGAALLVFKWLIPALRLGAVNWRETPEMVCRAPLKQEIVGLFIALA